MTDKVLRQTILDELDFQPSVDATNIGVTVDNGVVTLTGHVASYAEKVAAERAVERIKGVRAIAEKIEVRYPGHKQTADDEIADRALSILGWNVQVPKDSVKVKVEKGWVTLTGVVHWQYSAWRRSQPFGSFPGSRRFEPHRGEAEGCAARCQAKDLDALKRNAELEADAIRVNVIDDKVVLEGKVKAWYERGIAARAAWSAPGVKVVQDDLAIG